MINTTVAGSRRDVYAGLIDRVMAQSAPAERDTMGERMRRIEEPLNEE